VHLPLGATKEDEEEGHKEEGPCYESHIDEGGAQVLNELLSIKTEQVKVLIEGTVIVIIREIVFFLCQPW
jgi:hypothetical protein